MVHTLDLYIFYVSRETNFLFITVADYLNTKSENPLDTIKWFLQMLISLFKEIFRTGRVSLVFSLLSLVALFCLTDR